MNIALAGFGQEGRASYDYWNTAGNALTIADERESVDGLPEGAQTILGDGAFSKLSDFDLIIRSPSVNPKKLPYGEKVWSATNEFFAHCPAPIIGVTGTKGKGTTSSLIASILTAAGKTVHLVGNIGTPALLELPNITQDDIVVFEISSFQLWDIKKSPHVAVVLMIEPDHLDTHDDMDDYVNAKTNIVRFQTQDDVVVFNKNNQISVQIAAQSAGKQIEYPFDLGEIAESIVLPGPHNVENTAAAVAATREYVSDVEVIKNGVSSFTGLPHRIKFVREINGVKFYDDSYSSAPGASIAALKSFIDPKIIILGGYDKHADFSELAGYVAHDATIKKAILIGQTKQRIADEFAKLGIGDERYELIADSTFSDIIRHASEIAVPGDVILLSPGCASFDMFKNFTDRGEQFVQIVNTL
jgi:UDP-N-acetylmuramoylalanine--D-glutamate ligase